MPLRLRWREQYPRRCDSLEQPSREQSRLHCFPLNFFRMPLGVETTSPFLYLCGVPGGRDLGEEGVDLSQSYPFEDFFADSASQIVDTGFFKFSRSFSI